ncbi:hypothetical protein FA09DRAFT_293849 [Tilletiopsis washingtonensis]|uniref:Peptidase S28 n=1 Tax=Tilletiopsis washingtonensis TaxID=58919 RepID=A0A316ZFQ6_9BASI|nr:hypothetical protein FA09DRAFT_293849 [Tilletiopsis washingtonensis]PWO00588.1 hypothetical protein FA09DRAFT_293849 [Tilletiopsis washingtonensis]
MPFSHLFPSAAKSHIRNGTFTQPLDHFDGSTNVTFEQRFWYTLEHLDAKRKPDSVVPLIVYDGGETSGDNRLSNLRSGVVNDIARAVQGIPIILEHRYYGESFPDRKLIGPGEAWRVDQLRWLNNRQALEDSARFVRELKIKGVEDDLRAPHQPVIYYGGSYAGTRAAHMRALYPDVIFGGIASSAVLAAIDDFPAYFAPIARGSTSDCTQSLQSAIAWMDSILAPEPERGQVQPLRSLAATQQLQSLFGLSELSDPADFANALTSLLGSFQGLNWDAHQRDPTWTSYCRNATRNPFSGPLPPTDGSYHEPIEGREVPLEVSRLATFMRKSIVEPCTKKESAEECFGTGDWTRYTNVTGLDDLSERVSWTFQYCTTWGFLQTSPRVSTPAKDARTYHVSMPKLLSALVDREYMSRVCRQGFPAGEHYKMPESPNVDWVNELGSFALSSSRLAIINGQYDPWRPASGHSEEYAFGGARHDSLDRPFILIPDCWHHCDSNTQRKDGDAPPKRVADVQAREVQFVKHWLQSFERK